MHLANEVFIPEIVKMLHEGHTVTLRLRGYSMRPFLEDNRDKALLAMATNPQVGDAVLAEVAPRRYVLHRIISIEGQNVTLRGDGNTFEEHCQKSDVKATALGFYRKGRTQIDLTTGRKWKLYSYLWTRLYPLRRYLLFIHRHLLVGRQA